MLKYSFFLVSSRLVALRVTRGLISKACVGMAMEAQYKRLRAGTQCMKACVLLIRSVDTSVKQDSFYCPWCHICVQYNTWNQDTSYVHIHTTCWLHREVNMPQVDIHFHQNQCFLPVRYMCTQCKSGWPCLYMYVHINVGQTSRVGWRGLRSSFGFACSKDPSYGCYAVASRWVVKIH